MYERFDINFNMNHSSFIVLLILTFILIIFSSSANILEHPNIMKLRNYNFIQDTCNKTEELKDVCISVIDNNPHEDLKSTLKGILVIFVNENLRVIVEDRSYLLNQTALNGESSLDNRTRQVFVNCVTQYQMSKDCLEVLLEEELLKKGNADLNMDLGQIDNYLALCEIDFEGFAEEPSAWKSRYEYVNSLLILSLRITNLIKCNHIHVC